MDRHENERILKPDGIFLADSADYSAALIRAAFAENSNARLPVMWRCIREIFFAELKWRNVYKSNQCQKGIRGSP
jgi:hypothetical protein